MEKSKSKFSAFPARDELQQQQDKNSEPKRVLEPVLPTVRQPEKAFAPTPLPQPQKATEIR